jgi:cytochrome P450
MADLSDMKYGGMCIKEALRLYPSVSGWFRRLVADVKLGRIQYIVVDCSLMEWL